MSLREQLSDGNRLGADVDESSLSSEQREQLQSLQKEISCNDSPPDK